MDISNDTMARLHRDLPDKVVGLKESTGMVDRVSQLRAMLDRDFCILSGDDSLTLPMMSVGADGVISVASNVMPREVTEMTHAALKGDFERAGRIHAKLFPLFKDLFIETNPIPVKAAMAMMGQIEEKYRLPLVPMGETNKAQLRKTLQGLNAVGRFGEAARVQRRLTESAYDHSYDSSQNHHLRREGPHGSRLIACAQADPELQLVGEIDQGDDLRKSSRCDAVVDFSVHETTAAVARLAAEHKKALVIGTTGHTDAEKQAVRAPPNRSRRLVGQFQHRREHAVLDDGESCRDRRTEVGSRDRRDASHRQEGCAERHGEDVCRKSSRTRAARKRPRMRCASATWSAITQ